jgi:beta-galactosidase/beta-glucuronidase
MRFLVFIALLASVKMTAQWQPAGDKIKSKWAATVSPEKVWSEYPRPQMVRAEWSNLNGLWDYAIRPKESGMPEQWDGEILVPFAVESSLSGVMQTIGPEQVLWYHTAFEVPESWSDDQIVLHFGAVDWRAEVWINDIQLGQHEGGYDGFSFDLTPFLKEGKQELVVKVWDPTDHGPQPRGKQVSNPRGIWYTAVTGIWQTVWLEPVGGVKHITGLNYSPSPASGRVEVTIEGEQLEYGDLVEVSVLEGEQLVASAKGNALEPVTLWVKEAKLWSPEDPFLYDVKVVLRNRNAVPVDEVSSYFGMRSIAMQKDERGIMRMLLNGEEYFHFGPLDQGWWPDGLYTAPSDEALAYDIIKTKEYGFNTIRKHVKVEPDRWYYHCDRLGMLVWQDMPSGDRSNGWQNRKMYDGNELKRSPESEAIYRKEWKEIIDALKAHPSIVVWVPFNEAWGQFKTAEISDWTKLMDPSRLVNSASGGNHIPTGDILDLHNYPHPEMYLYDPTRVNVLGEYGGIGLPLQGHLWRPDDNWGYVKFKDSGETTAEYVKYARQLLDLARQGFAGAIYTQTTDVEGEVNGLMTYDRAVDKLEIEAVRKANLSVIHYKNN